MKDSKPRNDQQKEKEVRALEATRRLGNFIPSGVIVPYERPDLKIETEHGILGIEVTEALLPLRDGLLPVEKESFHREVIKLAEEIYYRSSGAKPVQVHVYWSVKSGGRNSKLDMARKLAEFVEANCPLSVAAFRRKRVPEGFGQIIISSWRPGPWTNGESYYLTVPEIYKELASKIADKNKLLLGYRARMPGSAIWLLIHSGVEITRGLWAPNDIGEQKFTFDFEKVLFLSCLSNQVVILRNG
jgi:hypothetical protein